MICPLCLDNMISYGPCLHSCFNCKFHLNDSINEDLQILFRNEYYSKKQFKKILKMKTFL